MGYVRRRRVCLAPNLNTKLDAAPLSFPDLVRLTYRARLGSARTLAASQVALYARPIE